MLFYDYYSLLSLLLESMRENWRSQSFTAPGLSCRDDTLASEQFRIIPYSIALS